MAVAAAFHPAEPRARRLADGVLFLLAITLLTATPPLAKAGEISRFFGHFEGTGISENSDPAALSVTVRELDVVIRGAPDGAFRIDWTTIMRPEGVSGDSATLKSKRANIVFHPTGRPGLYSAEGGGDPLDGTPLWWSRIDGATLHTYMLEIDADGRWQMQKYARTVSGRGMTLVFERLVDGEPTRRVRARLAKVGD